MKRFLMVISCLVILSGCATTQMVKTETPPELAAKPDMALLVIARDTFMGGGIVFWNYLDQKFIGETMGNTYFVTQVPPGEHYVVGATENTGVAKINFEAGKKYYLRQGVTMGLWRARTSGFFPMTSEEMDKAVKKCTYLEIDPSKTFPDMEEELYKKAIDEYHVGVAEDPEAYKDMIDYKGE